MTEPLPAETSGPLSLQTASAACSASAPSLTRCSTFRVKLPTSGGPLRNQAR